MIPTINSPQRTAERDMSSEKIVEPNYGVQDAIVTLRHRFKMCRTVMPTLIFKGSISMFLEEIKHTKHSGIEKTFQT